MGADAAGGEIYGSVGRVLKEALRMSGAVTKVVLEALRYNAVVRRMYDRRAVRKWESAGRPIPPPYAIKRRTILEYAQRFGCKIFIETGTYMGDTPWALRDSFRELNTIELHQGLYERARRVFARVPHVNCIQGDSGQRLPELVKKYNEPILFWLDGHYCGEGTGRGVEDAPVMREIVCIFDHPVRDHVILLDDARDFVGRSGYPTVEALRDWVAKRRPDWVFLVEHDVIRIHRAG